MNNKIICPSCSAENPQDKKFCIKCGSRLTAAEPEQKSVPEKKTVICPSCSTENQQGKKFCMKCGSKLTAADPPKKSVPVKNTVIKNTDKSSSRPVFADKPHANVSSKAAAVTVKNKINMKIVCAAIIAALLILAGIVLMLNFGPRDSESRANVNKNEAILELTTTVQTASTEIPQAEDGFIQSDYFSEDNAVNNDTAENLDQTEKQIRILEDYYENTIKSMREYDQYKISGAGAGEIYALNNDGDCFLLVGLGVDTDNMLGDSITLFCTVDSNGNVNTETLVYNTGGSISYSSVEIKKCSVNNKFYYVNYFHGLEQYTSYSYASFDGSEDLKIYMRGVDSLFYVDGYSVTQSSYEEYTSYLDSIMIDPVPTRKDGDVSVYLQDFSAVNNNKIPAGAELVPPEYFGAYINGEGTEFVWGEVDGSEITYNLYVIENGEHICIGYTTNTNAYLEDNEEKYYCVTADSDSIYVFESPYSNTCKAFEPYM